MLTGGITHEWCVDTSTVNELGKIDIDGALLKSTDNNAGLGICTQELTNGCVCCHVKDDLRRAVLSVLERRDTVDYLVIETSGAADPRPGKIGAKIRASMMTVA